MGPGRAGGQNGGLRVRRGQSRGGQPSPQEELHGRAAEERPALEGEIQPGMLDGDETGLILVLAADSQFSRAARWQRLVPLAVT